MWILRIGKTCQNEEQSRLAPIVFNLLLYNTIAQCSSRIEFINYLTKASIKTYANGKQHVEHKPINLNPHLP